MNGKTDLSKYDNSWYKPGGSIIKRLCWFIVNASLFICPLFPFRGFKIFILRMFGAKVGSGVNIKPSVNIKYPWRLIVGDYSWIGENVWIDNLADVSLGKNVCLSQGALLLTGNHNYKKETFDLITGNITLEDGVWIGAKAVVCPGVKCGAHALLTAGSVAVSDLEPFGIYQGNPAIKIREREIVLFWLTPGEMMRKSS